MDTFECEKKQIKQTLFNWSYTVHMILKQFRLDKKGTHKNASYNK